jgi:uncharacterized protein YndB with AHSA1/START domain
MPHECVVRDEVWIAHPPARVYRALTDSAELARWWPREAVSDPRAEGRLVFTWFSGDRLETRYERLVPDREVAFPFASERVAFELAAEGAGTRLRIVHECGTDDSIHIAQSWGFLKANLKAYLEAGLDLRER